MGLGSKSAYMDDKSIELFIYVTNKLKDKSNYGATLLNKALYFIDNISYAKFKKSVTNFDYVRQGFGPTLRPKQFMSIKSKLIKDDIINEVQSEYFGRVQRKLIPTRKADLTEFGTEEISFIDDVISAVADANASEISYYTHSLLQWKVAEDKESLPLFTYLLSSRTPTETEITWAKDSIAAYA